MNPRRPSSHHRVTFLAILATVLAAVLAVVLAVGADATHAAHAAHAAQWADATGAFCSNMYLVLGTDRRAVMEDRVHAAAYEIFRTRLDPSETCVTLAGKHKSDEEMDSVPSDPTLRSEQHKQSNPEAFIMFNLFHDTWKRLELEWGSPRPVPLVLVEHQSTNTAENFVCATRLWREKRIRVSFELTIVTSDFHVDRSIHLAESLFQDEPVDDAYRFFFDDENAPLPLVVGDSLDPDRTLRVIGSPDVHVPGYAIDLEPLHRSHARDDARRARVGGSCVY